MNARQVEPPLPSPDRTLTRAFIDDYLQMRGVDRHSLESLPHSERTWLLNEAELYAAARLAEIEARADLVRQGGMETRPKRRARRSE